ncbi:hypothetical protein ACOSQ2_033250 [Xanthoceras sorbifolium]
MATTFSIMKKIPTCRIRTSDLRISNRSNPLQSSALPTELRNFSIGFYHKLSSISCFSGSLATFEAAISFDRT